MSVEIEAKVKVDCHEDVVEKLRQNDGVLKDDIRQVDVYFDDAEGGLSDSDRGLRIRRQILAESEKTILTYKGQRQLSQYKIRPEYETEVGDYEMTVGILNGLGFERSLAVEKKRQLWQLGDCLVCLDEVELLGKFVEVEGPSEQSINKVLGMIGLENCEFIKNGYAKMLYKKLNETESDGMS